jgi:hypothetical protein
LGKTPRGQLPCIAFLDALLDLIARLPGLLLNAIDDLVRVVACLVGSAIAMWFRGEQPG